MSRSAGRSLAEWLAWQESLHPRWMELSLDRVRTVASRLDLRPPQGGVITVGGTNGKGSTVALLEHILAGQGRRVAAYTSPHLVRYNERVRVDRQEVADDELCLAFAAVEEARGDVQLTFFEFGTLAALVHFTRCGCDYWALEVGLGGRLDAVNLIDADAAIVTTVDLDHQEYLGNDVESIAAEKAGIFRRDRIAVYGDWPAPASLKAAAAAVGASLSRLGVDFDFSPDRPYWRWRGAHARLEGLHWPPGGALAQLRNAGAAFAALERLDPRLLGNTDVLNAAILGSRPPGRFQQVLREHEWILDVAHNPQSVAVLSAQLASLPPTADCTIVLGIFADKDLAAFPRELAHLVRRWICCRVTDPRARDAESIAMLLRASGCEVVAACDGPESALREAARVTERGGRIIVCGSFRMVGPALHWLGIY
ncbi:MAG: bifunctional tetrahydrofolate synthase/dihydrofolate synthase [Gammaproteobacteria bacterium]|nr:bifunctional tetrahydrofolate synthase/dihydrofolate synthase [Gammaproteobacteria bacterium]